MPKLKLLLYALTCCLITGCASIFSSGPENLTLQSSPTGATYQYGTFSGKTPDTIAVPRNAISKAYSVSFSLPGYNTKSMPVDTRIQGVTWLDLLFWPGFIVDFATGNAYALATPVVNATLQPAVASAAPSTPPVAAK
ncbi:MAG TPA: hypothetical protein VKV28_04735 [Candidatus Binataceae bacterium]|nr:hypothetical protein [Candidatus Binataceae bacterium]